VEPAVSRVRWLLTSWIFVVSAVAYLDRVNISVAGQAISREFGLSNIQLGWVFSAFVGGYALFQTPGGWISDRLGPRLVLTLGVVWWGVIIAATTLLTSGTAWLLALLIAARFLLGMGEAVLYPASNCFVARWIPSSERGIANGLIFAGVGVGAGFSTPFTVYLVTHYGWRVSFLGSAVLGLSVGSVWYWLARDRPDIHPWVSSGEKALIEAGLAGNNPDKRGASLSWKAIVGDRNVWAVTLSYFCFGYTAYIFFSWFFIYLSTVRSLNLRESSFYSMLPFIAMAAGSIVGGIASDSLTQTYGKRVGRCFFAAVAIGMSATFVALGAQVGNARIASFILAGGAGALYLSQSCFWAMSADIGNRSAGSVSGFMNMGGQIGGALTASLTPAIAASFGWAASFIVAAALCACGACLWLAVLPSEESQRTWG
jgi:ACS family glucarate transporter-like MFS transporter